MHIPDRITEQLLVATTAKQALDIMLDECFSLELQEAAWDWCIEHRPELKLDD